MRSITLGIEHASCINQYPLTFCPMAANSSDSSQQTATSPRVVDPRSTVMQQVRNLIIVMVAAILTVAVVLGYQTKTPTASLSTLAEGAVPLEQALVSGKPSFVEFYANWCTSCQAMAGDMEQLKQAYGDRINFVMLNVDNSKWLPEMLHYHVDGIPHFVYLTAQGDDAGTVIGEQPRTIIAENLEALLVEQTLPHANATGRASEVKAPPVDRQRPDDPRSHGV